MNKAYSARLKSATIDDFRRHLDRYPLSFWGKIRYGRCPKNAPLVESMFSQNTTCEVGESPSHFHYIYTDVRRGDIVARVTAVRYRTDELSINLAWDEESAGLYMGGLIFSIKHFWTDAVIERGGTQKSDEQIMKQAPLADSTDHLELVKDEQLVRDIDVFDPVLLTLAEDQLETLQLIVDGLNQKRIAVVQMIKPETVKYRKQQIAKKLNIEGDATEDKLKQKGIELGLKPRVETYLSRQDK